MPIDIGEDRYYTMKEFANEVDRAYSYIRKCVNGLERAKDLDEYVVNIENKPMIKEEAICEFKEKS